MRFRVLTYNVHQCVGTDGHKDAARVAEVIRHHAPDIVCLQEVAWHAHEMLDTAQPRQLARMLEYPYAAIGFYRNLKGGAWGNMTFSRFPIAESETLDLTLRVRWRKTRGALYTLLHVHGRNVHLLNVHFGLTAFERRAQMGWVIERVDELAPQGAPVVLIGDTNDWRNVLVRGDCSQSGFTSPTCDRVNPGHATFPSTGPNFALDKVFLRGHVRARRATVSRLALAKLASDHLPLLVELELTSS